MGLKGIMKSRSIATCINAPTNWQITYSIVEELRKDKTAPIDYSGADILPQRCRGDVIFRYQVLICLMLSSQTKDVIVGQTIKSLQKHGLDVETIANKTSLQKL